MDKVFPPAAPEEPKSVSRTQSTDAGSASATATETVLDKVSTPTKNGTHESAAATQVETDATASSSSPHEGSGSSPATKAVATRRSTVAVGSSAGNSPMKVAKAGPRRYSFGSTMVDEQLPKVKTDPNYVPSDRLLKSTQARILDTKELEARKNRIKDEDDPWWDVRKPVPTVPKSHSNNVTSKLMQPTTAYEQQKRAKSSEVQTPEKHLHTKPIDAISPLLKPTLTSLYGMWQGSETLPPPQIKENRSPERSKTGPDVPSKLMQPTKAMVNAQWKSKEQREKEEAEAAAQRRASAPKINAVSDRLLSPNAAARAGMRTKVVEQESDPREAGWKDFRAHVQIPTLDQLTIKENTRRSPAVFAHEQPIEVVEEPVEGTEQDGEVY